MWWLADPDEWDDVQFPDGSSPDDYGTWNGFLTTPEISIKGVQEGSLVLHFDLSWRPEDTQTAVVSVSYDGSDWIEVRRFESDEASDHYEPDTQNWTLNILLNNPAATDTARIRFALIDSTNDWWWAVDNIEVYGVCADDDSCGDPESLCPTESSN